MWDELFFWICVEVVHCIYICMFLPSHILAPLILQKDNRGRRHFPRADCRAHEVFRGRASVHHCVARPQSSPTPFRSCLTTPPYHSRLLHAQGWGSFPTKPEPQLHSEICEENLHSDSWLWQAFSFSLVTKAGGPRRPQVQEHLP